MGLDQNGRPEPIGAFPELSFKELQAQSGRNAKFCTKHRISFLAGAVGGNLLWSGTENSPEQAKMPGPVLGIWLLSCRQAGSRSAGRLGQAENGPGAVAFGRVLGLW